MTRKEALATLYTFWEAFFRLSGSCPLHGVNESVEQARTERASQAYQALLTLTTAIHGKAPLDGSTFLCDVCHLRYADGYAYEEFGGLCEPCRAAQTVPPKKVGEV